MTREEFIGKLRSIYVGEENAIDEIISEYDRLKGALQTHEILLKTNVKEIERLNNVINELEKWCNETMKKYKIPLVEQNKGALGFTLPIQDAYQQVLDKLKALKEDNKDV